MNFLFSFNGRIGRQQYLLGGLGLGIVATLLAGLVGGIMQAIADGAKQAGQVANATSSPAMLAVGAVFVLLLIATLWASLALIVKRNHDRGRSGWFALLSIVPLVNIWLAIDMIFLRGDRGSNKFGPPVVPEVQTA